MHLAKVDIEHLYAKRENSGRVLNKPELIYKIIYVIKEILGYYNRVDITVSKRT